MFSSKIVVKELWKHFLILIPTQHTQFNSKPIPVCHPFKENKAIFNKNGCETGLNLGACRHFTDSMLLDVVLWFYTTST